MAEQGTSDENKIAVVRGMVGSLSLYEITDYELEILERGSPNSVLLNFAIFAFSIGISFLTTVCVVTFTSIYMFTTFLVLTILGLFSGLVLFVIWYRTRSSTSEVCRKIRLRIPSSSIVAASEVLSTSESDSETSNQEESD